MFLFVNFAGNTRSAAQDKGKAFQRLVGELVGALGYKEVELRAKVAGKEYDVRAKAKLGDRLLIGQAKASDRQIAASVVSEFVGSLDLEEFPEDEFGLFLSSLTYHQMRRTSFPRPENPRKAGSR